VNVYAGVPDNIRELIEQAATRAFAEQIRSAIHLLRQGQGDRYEAVISVLEAMIGEDE